jgi:hypothetical protein
VSAQTGRQSSASRAPGTLPKIRHGSGCLMQQVTLEAGLVVVVVVAHGMAVY